MEAKINRLIANYTHQCKLKMANMPMASTVELAINTWVVKFNQMNKKQLMLSRHLCKVVGIIRGTWETRKSTKREVSSCTKEIRNKIRKKAAVASPERIHEKQQTGGWYWFWMSG